MNIAFAKHVWALLLLLAFVSVNQNAFAQVDVLEQIEAELEAEKEKQKALEKAAKNAEKFAIKYSQTINKADVLLKSEKYDEALEAYKEAIIYKPDDHYAPEQIKETERLKKHAIEEAKRLEKEKAFSDKMTEANASLSEKKWDEAIALYEEAKKIKPENQQAISKIAEAKKLKKEEEEARKAKEAAEALQKQYDDLMAEADKLLTDESFDAARAKFQEASKLKPAEQSPKNKILECDKLKADFLEKQKQEEIQNKYDAIIVAADDLLKDEKFDDARNKYDEAIKLKPSESYPHKQIEECDRLKKEFKQKEKDNQYAELIEQADQLLKDSEFDKAKVKYEEALKFKPGDSYAQTQVIESDKQKKQAAIDKLTEKFNQIIAEADDLLKNNDFDAAIARYDDAHKIMPDNAVATNKVKEATALKKEFQMNSKKEEYAKFLESGDELLKEEKFDEAIAEYAKAEKILPENPEAQSRIEQAKKTRSDLEAKNKEERYFAYIDEGDDAFKSKNYEAARTSYNNAEKLMPAKEEARTKMHELNEHIKQEKQDGINKEYESLMAKGNELLSDENFDEAVIQFQQAHKLKASETEPNTKIQEANKLKAEKLARLEKENSEKEKQEKFDALMSEAQAHHSEANYQKAISTYHLALEVKPNESTTLEELEKSKAALKEEEQQKAEEAKRLARMQNLEKQYNDLLKAGDQAIQQNEFATAKEKYNEAGALMPEAKDHIEKLKEAEEAEQSFIAEQKAAREKEQALLAEKKQKESEVKEMEKKVQEYESLLDKGNNALASEDFEKAIDNYTAAASLLPSDDRASKKLENAKKAKQEKEAELLAEQKNKQESEAAAQRQKEEQALKKQKDEEMMRKQNLEKRYNDLISLGDQAIQQKEFASAKLKYNEAAELMPDGTVHLQKIEAAEKAEQTFIAEQNAAREKEEQLLAEKKKQQSEVKEMEKKVEQYESLLDKGNNALASEDFSKAIEHYSAASKLLPTDERAPRKLENTRKAKLEKEAELLAEKRKLKAKEESAQKQKEEQALQKQREEEYNILIKKGNSAISDSKFKEAITFFKQAEEVMPGKQQTKDFLNMAEDKLKKKEANLAEANRQNRFETFYNSAETAYKEGNYDLAFSSIDEAKKIKPEDPLLLSLENRVEKKALAEEEKLARQMALKKLDGSSKNDFTVVYLDPNRIKRLDEIKFVHDLASKYPEGLTVQYRTDDRKEVEVRIVVQRTLGAEYQKVTHDWGGTYYFKNGKNVSSYIWQKEAGGM